MPHEPFYWPVVRCVAAEAQGTINFPRYGYGCLVSGLKQLFYTMGMDGKSCLKSSCFFWYWRSTSCFGGKLFQALPDVHCTNGVWTPKKNLVSTADKNPIGSVKKPQSLYAWNCDIMEVYCLQTQLVIIIIHTGWTYWYTCHFWHFLP